MIKRYTNLRTLYSNNDHTHWRRSLLGTAGSRPPTFRAHWVNTVIFPTTFFCLQIDFSSIS